MAKGEKRKVKAIELGEYISKVDGAELSGGNLFTAAVVKIYEENVVVDRLEHKGKNYFIVEV